MPREEALAVILQVIDAFMMSDANNPMQDSVQVDSFLVCWTDSKLRFLLFPALGLCRIRFRPTV